MEEIERITTTINRVAPSVSPIGRNDPTALSTKEGFVYRETGFNQIEDIIECGYVRSNEHRKSNQVWWTKGGSNSFHVNKKRPVLVASSDIVIDCKEGAISIYGLTEIWIYDEATQKWNNKIDDIKTMYVEKQQKKYVDNIEHLQSNNNDSWGLEENDKPKRR